MPVLISLMISHTVLLSLIIHLVKVLFSPFVWEMDAFAPGQRQMICIGCAFAAWTLHLSDFSVTRKNDILLLLNRLLQSNIRNALHYHKLG